MAKHAHRVNNLVKRDVDLVEVLDQTWSCFCGRLMLITFKFACNSICSFGETSEWESFFSKVCLLHFVPCLRSSLR